MKLGTRGFEPLAPALNTLKHRIKTITLFLNGRSPIKKAEPETCICIYILYFVAYIFDTYNKVVPSFYLEVYTYMNLGVYPYKRLINRMVLKLGKIWQAEKVKITSGILNNSEVLKSPY
jgi:hypothetical protein